MVEEDAPTPGFLEALSDKILNTIDFKLNYEKENYILKVKSSQECLYLEITKDENFIYFYEISLRLSELINLDKIFKICENMNDAFDLLVSNIKSYKNEIKKISEHNLILSINILQPNHSVVEKEISLNKKYHKSETTIEKLVEEIKQLKLSQKNMEKEILELKQENNKLKDLNELKELKDKINYFMDPTKIKSNIITDENKFEFIKERLAKVGKVLLKGNENPKISFELLYRAKKHGDKAKDFHIRCDLYRNTLTIIKTKEGLTFGGFTTQTWEGIDLDKKDKNAFCFSVDKNKIYNSVNGKSAIFASPEYGPSVQNCIFEVKGEFFVNEGECNDGADTFYDNIESSNEINGGKNSFAVEDLEVHAVYFE